MAEQSMEVVRHIVGLCAELGVELDVLEVLAKRAYERSQTIELRVNIEV